MINMPLIGVATALVACAIVARVFAHGQQKADKAQKGEVIKQLLALSERESRLLGTPSSGGSRAPLSKQGTLVNLLEEPGAQRVGDLEHGAKHLLA